MAIFSAILLHITMVKSNAKSYYFAAVIIGLSVGLATRDMPVGILLAVVLMVIISGLKKKDENG